MRAKERWRGEGSLRRATWCWAEWARLEEKLRAEANAAGAIVERAAILH